MPRRIDIELTSALSDGSWTWRAAGARNPKGTVDGSIIPAGSSVGDELKVEVEQMLDGMEILSVVKGREKADRSGLLELIPDDKPFEAVIETRARRDRSDRDRSGRGGDRDGRSRGRGDKRGDKRPPDDRDGRGRGDGPSRGGEGRGRDDEAKGRRERSERPKRPHFEAPPEVPQRPKPKRLRPGKARRSEVLAAVPEEQRPIAELALQGLAVVRSRVKEENAKLKHDGKPEMPEAAILKMAEEMLPKLRVADWLDRADAALRQMKQLDLRDLRSVVAASDDSMVARDESTREIAAELKIALAAKQVEEMTHWLEDVEAALNVGRVIRALRLSSQPPKAGVMFPPQLARRLGEATVASLLPEDSGDRWSAVLEAAAFSPVRALVVPTTPPTTITDDLKKTALRLGPLLPQIAALLGVEVPPNARRPKPLRPTSRKDAKKERTERSGERSKDRPPRERDERGRAPRAPRDRPKGMRDVSTVMKAAAEADAAAEAARAAEAASDETAAPEAAAEPAADTAADTAVGAPAEPSTDIAAEAPAEPAADIGGDAAPETATAAPEPAEAATTEAAAPEAATVSTERVEADAPSDGSDDVAPDDAGTADDAAAAADTPSADKA